MKHSKWLLRRIVLVAHPVVREHILDSPLLIGIGHTECNNTAVLLANEVVNVAIYVGGAAGNLAFIVDCGRKSSGWLRTSKEITCSIVMSSFA